MRTDLQNTYQQNLKRERGKKLSRRIWIGFLSFLMIVLASVIGWYVLSGKQAQIRYEEYMDVGNRYLVELDYESAEIFYKKAMEEIPEQANAYEKLANVYLIQNRYEEAGELLAAGIRYTKDDSLVKTYQRVLDILKNLQNGESGNIANVLLSAPRETEEEQDEESAGEQRSVSGYIINAVNGGGVMASIRFLRGGRYGMAERETSARSDGSFAIKLRPGQYTVEIRATGFITSYEEINIAGDLKGRSFTLSPELESGEIRIVLTWGDAPRDLDSHLEGIGSDGERVDVSYSHKEAGNMAGLDLDDTSGFGPETTTIYDIGGSYHFRVYNFSQDSELEESGAVIRIYLPGEGEPMMYEVPSGAGNWWDVCTIEDGQVTSINVIR